MTSPSAAGAQQPWQIRALQVDLARHPETVDYLRRYADFAASHGFNTLVLYLEARVRTPAFPVPAGPDRYSLDDMDRVVRHARAAGLVVVPAVSTLGHCEQFLAHPPLAALDELRDGGRGRFGTVAPGTTLCPSLDETYDFFSRYFAELAQVFPGPYFHVGLDEVWDLGYCPQCRQRWRQEGLGGLFTRHLLRIHQLAARFWPRIWLWDDMYEFFPEETARIPKSAVMCHWQYDDIISREGGKAHFANRRRRDWLADYEALGLDALICPWAVNLRNLETFTEYGRRRRILGGLLTQWEGSPRFHAANALAVAYGGRLWNQPGRPDAAWRAAVRTVLPGVRGAVAAALENLGKTNKPHLATDLATYLAGPLEGEEWLRRQSNRLALAVLAESPVAGVKANRPALETLRQLEVSGREDRLYWDLRNLLPEIYDPQRRPDTVPELAGQLADLEQETKALARWWRQHQLKMPDRHPADTPLIRWQALSTLLQAARTRLETTPGEDDWLMLLRLFLQDYHGAQKLKVTLYAGAEEITVTEGVIKPGQLIIQNRGSGHYDIQRPFTFGNRPAGLRIESWGYGGQGVCFVELRNPRLRLIPDTIRKVSGTIAQPHAILTDDSACAFFGLADIRAEMASPELAEQRHCLDLGLKQFRPAVVVPHQGTLKSKEDLSR